MVERNFFGALPGDVRVGYATPEGFASFGLCPSMSGVGYATPERFSVRLCGFAARAMKPLLSKWKAAAEPRRVWED